MAAIYTTALSPDTFCGWYDDHLPSGVTRYVFSDFMFPRSLYLDTGIPGKSGDSR
jgi:hypothetical protein